MNANHFPNCLNAWNKIVTGAAWLHLKCKHLILVVLLLFSELRQTKHLADGPQLSVIIVCSQGASEGCTFAFLVRVQPTNRPERCHAKLWTDR